MPRAGRSSTPSSRDGVTARVSRVAGARTGRIGVLVAPDGERSFVADRGAADLLAPGDLQAGLVRAAPMPCTCRSTRCSASRSGWPAVGPSSSRARPDAMVSVDLASIGPLLAEGPARGPGARSRRSRRTCCSRPPPRRRRCSGAPRSRGCSSSRRSSSSSAGRRGRRSWPASGDARPPLRGRDRARRRDRHDRRRRRVRCRLPRRLVQRPRRRPCPADVAPAGGPGRPPGGGSAAAGATDRDDARVSGSVAARDSDVVDLDLDQAVGAAIDRLEVDPDRLAGPGIEVT